MNSTDERIRVKTPSEAEAHVTTFHHAMPKLNVSARRRRKRKNARLARQNTVPASPVATAPQMRPQASLPCLRRQHEEVPRDHVLHSPSPPPALFPTRDLNTTCHEEAVTKSVPNHGFLQLICREGDAKFYFQADGQHELYELNTWNKCRRCLSSRT